MAKETVTPANETITETVVTTPVVTSPTNTNKVDAPVNEINALMVFSSVETFEHNGHDVMNIKFTTLGDSKLINVLASPAYVESKVELKAGNVYSVKLDEYKEGSRYLDKEGSIQRRTKDGLSLREITEVTQTTMKHHTIDTTYDTTKARIKAELDMMREYGSEYMELLAMKAKAGIRD